MDTYLLFDLMRPPLFKMAHPTVAEAKAGARLTLRCFCEGIDENKDVLLKSCIRP